MTLNVPNTYSHISTDTTTTLKAESGTLVSVIVNSAGSGTGTITIFDSATAGGTIVAVITPNNPVPLFYNVALLQGLTVQTAGAGTPADITVVWS